jgi:putative ABC transport system permease protein
MSLIDDIRFAFRMLAKQRTLTIIAVFTLGLGIGANTAIFSCADAMLFKPLGLPDSDRLAMLVLTESRPAKGSQYVEQHAFSAADFFDWQQSTKTLESAAAYSLTALNLSSTGEPERVRGARVLPSLFDVLPIAPLAGRVLRPGDDEPGRDRVVVLSERVVTRRFGGNINVIGNTVKLNGAAHEIVGVMPARFEYPLTVDVWLPLALTPAQRQNRGNQVLGGIARLRRGVTFDGAAAELASISQRIANEHPDTNARYKGTVLPLRTSINGTLTYEYFKMLLGAVTIVLLIACVNVANLLLGSGAARAREIAVRAALGASKWRLVRLLLVESMLRAVAGGAVGILLGAWGIELLRVNMPPEVARFIAGWDQVALDFRALLFTLAIALAAGIVSGLAPALQASRTDVNDALKEGGRAGDGAQRHWMRKLLVLSEVTLAVVLAVAAALIVKGFDALARESAQFRPDTLLGMQTFLTEAKYADDADLIRFYNGVLNRMDGLPQVRGAAIANVLPHSRGAAPAAMAFTSSFRSPVFVQGEAPLARGDQHIAQIRSVSTSYFHVMNVPLLSGRELTDHDGPEAPKVAVVSESFAKQYLGTGPPIGKRVRIGGRDEARAWWQVVGIVADVRQGVYDRGPSAIIYRPFLQAPTRQMGFLLRANGAPEGIVPAVRAQVNAVDPQQPLYDIKPMERMISEGRLGLSYVASLMGIMGLLATVLSAVGLYGLIAYTVAERTHEIGIRMAVGARAWDVVGMVVRSGGLLTALGVALGLTLAFGFARGLAAMFFGVDAGDITVYAGVAALLGAVALLACILPARRAARMDPMAALRHE